MRQGAIRELRYKPLQITFVLLACVSVSSAQSDGYSTANNLRGVVPFGSYQFGEIDNVNLGTGALNVRIPLFSTKGRGLDYDAAVVYSNKIWAARPILDLYIPGVARGLSWDKSRHSSASPRIATPRSGQLTWKHDWHYCTYDPGGPNHTEFQVEVFSDFVYTAPDGASLQFPNRRYINTSGLPCDSHDPSFEVSTNVATSDSGAAELNTTQDPYLIRFEDGTQLKVSASSGGVNEVKDTNGNIIDGSGDTLKRQYLWQNGQLTVKDSDGSARVYTFQYSPVWLRTQFPTTDCGGPVNQYETQNFMLTAILLPNGRSFNFSYDPNTGDLVRIDLPTGGYIRYEYVTLAESDLGPSILLCRLDSRRVSKRIVSPDGVTEQVWQYSYVGGTTVTDPLGNVSTHFFSTDGIHETQAEIKENIQGVLTTVRRVVNTWDSNLGPVQTGQDACTSSDERNWRITSTVTTLLDTNQVFKTETTYDTYTASPSTQCEGPYTQINTRMNVMEAKEYDFGSSAPGSLVRRTTFNYLHDSNVNYKNRHILDRVTSRAVYDGVSALKAQTTFSYDTTSITATSGVVQHDYTSNPYRGNQTEIKRWRNTDGAWLTSKNWFDDLGNVLQTQDPLLYNTFFTYADTWTTVPGGNACAPVGGTARAFVTQVTNHLNHISSTKYFSCSSLAGSVTDANNQTTTFNYTDPFDRLRVETRPDGGTTNWDYDDIAKKATRTQAIGGGVGSLVMEYFYDGLGRTFEGRLASDPQGTVFTVVEYDALGRAHKAWNPTRCSSPKTNNCESTWGISEMVYDGLGRVTKVIPPDGTVGANNVVTSYSGNTVTVTDQASKVRKSETDALGRLTRVWEPDASGSLVNVTQYTYDTLDNLTCVVQKGTDTAPFTSCAAAPAAWRPRSFSYNSLGQLLTATNPESGTITYTYDNDGNLITKVDARGVTTCMGDWSGTCNSSTGYDALHRLLKKTYSDGTPTATFTYDLATVDGLSITNPVGRLVKAATNNTRTVNSYDEMGRIEDQWQCTPQNCGSSWYTAHYDYNQAGAVTSQSNPFGFTLTSTYDSAGRLSQLDSSLADAQHPGLLASAFQYAPHGALAQRVLGYGHVNELRSYNNRLQPTSLLTQLPGPDTALWMGYSFTDAQGRNNGNVTAWTSTGKQLFNRSYAYDELNRVASLTASGEACAGLTWTYDIWGNRTNQTGSGGPCSEHHPTVTTNNRIAELGYDAAGNVTSDPAAVASYTYDAENRMLTSTSTLGNATYVYDAEGKRVQKTVDGVVTEFVYDVGGAVMAERQAGAWSKGYVMVGGMLGLYDNTANPPTTYFAHSDHLGSTRLLTRLDGTVAECDDYLPFGELNAGTCLPPAGTSATTHKFTGKERDSESGLDFFGARYHAPSLGRFHSPDPNNASGWLHTDDPQSWNAYSYSRNNPLRLIDPTGTDYCEVIVDEDGDESIGKCVSDEEYDENPAKYEGWIQVSEDQTVEVKETISDPLTPFLAVGGVAVAADGPLPVGDLIGAGIILGGLTVAYFADNNRHIADVVAGNIEQAWAHLRKLQNASPGDPNRNKWKGQARGFLEKARKMAEKLPGKARENAEQIIKTIEGLLGLQ